MQLSRRQAMRDRSGGSASMDPGGLYRLIARLEREGFVCHAARPAGDEDEMPTCRAGRVDPAAVLSAE